MIRNIETQHFSMHMGFWGRRDLVPRCSSSSSNPRLVSSAGEGLWRLQWEFILPTLLRATSFTTSQRWALNSKGPHQGGAEGGGQQHLLFRGAAQVLPKPVPLSHQQIPVSHPSLAKRRDVVRGFAECPTLFRIMSLSLSLLAYNGNISKILNKILSLQNYCGTHNDVLK